MKKLSALLLAFAMMLTMLSVASADDVQVIRMWSNDQHDQSVIKEKIEAFNATIGKENGIAVEYTVYGSDYYSTLDVAVTSKEGPDIFKCNKIGNYAEAGYILPWEEIPALSTLVERFSSYNAPGYGEFFGQTYSVPIRVTTYGIACNNLIKVMGCKTEERTLLVELVRAKCSTNLKARMSTTIQILLQWRIVVEVLILSDGLRLLYVIFPVIPVCTAAQNKWADQCRYNIFIYFHTTKFIFISLLRNYFHDSSLLPRLIIDIT